MRTFLTLVAATLAMLISAIPADAKIKKHHRIPVERIHIDAPINMAMTLSARRHYRHHGKQVYADPHWQPHLDEPQPELMPVQSREGRYRTSHLRHSRGYYRTGIYGDSITVASQNRTVIGGRPSGCPHAYCGCGLARHLGLHDVRLNLASNWARLFPHTSASPGAVAVRSHHVMQLVAHAGGNNWVVRDYNGGRGLSYIHTRNVAGYTFVSPNGKYASL